MANPNQTSTFVTIFIVVVAIALFWGVFLRVLQLGVRSRWRGLDRHLFREGDMPAKPVDPEQPVSPPLHQPHPHPNAPRAKPPHVEKKEQPVHRSG